MRITGKFTSAVFTVKEVEEQAIEQVRSLCNHPACTKPIVIMPDVHMGCSSPIGFTMPLGEKVVPNIVSVDIGCGMTSVKFDVNGREFFDTDELKKTFDTNLRNLIPMGFNINKIADKVWNESAFFEDLNDRLRKFYVKYTEQFGVEKSSMLRSIKNLSDFNNRISIFGGNPDRIIKGLASLGGGNHFCECSEGSDGKLWITVHCGSRNFGKQVCDYFQNKAWDIVERTKIKGKQSYIADLKNKISSGEYQLCDLNEAINEYDRTHQVVGITKQDAFLEGTDAYEYLYWMVVAQCYSDWNRKIIHERIAKIVGKPVLETINTTHNFISFKDFIIRKGSIESYKGQKMIIPFNPVDGILICEGKSNPDWNYSAPHGAGRIMSRTEAKKKITQEQANSVMGNVYASIKPIDESKLVYKDPAFIETALGSTATIIDRLIPIINFKADE